MKIRSTPESSAEDTLIQHRVIDLNADMGEYADDKSKAIESALLSVVTTCNIACGGHAGSPETMLQTLILAKQADVACGAHPSYPDREGFGRRTMTIPSGQLETSLRNQVTMLQDIAHTQNVPLRHLKPHGALYNDAARDIDLARLITKVAQVCGLTLFGPPGSALETAALQLCVEFVGEGFIDRAYQMNGALKPRSQPDAVLSDLDSRTAQGLALARGDALNLPNGQLTLLVQTLCIHSDSPDAMETAIAMRSVLDAAGISVKAWHA